MGTNEVITRMRRWQYAYSRGEVLVLLDEIDRLNARISELEQRTTFAGRVEQARGLFVADL